MIYSKEIKRGKGYLQIWMNLKNLKLYKKLEVLNCLHTEACSEILWPTTQYLLATVHILTNVLTIKCFNILPLMIRSVLILSAFAFIFFESSCLKSSADIFEISQKYKDTLSRDISKKNRLIGKSLRCLRIQVGHSYYFKFSTYTTFLRTIVEHTINVLLAINRL
jgi:hypothetical protein